MLKDMDEVFTNLQTSIMSMELGQDSINNVYSNLETRHMSRLQGMGVGLYR